MPCTNVRSLKQLHGARRCLAAALACSVVSGVALSTAGAQSHGWSKPTPIATSGLNPIQLDADAVYDASGNAHAIWVHPMGAQVASKPLGAAWQTPITLTGAQSAAMAVAIAAGRDGTVVAIWVDTIPGRYGRTAILEATRPPSASAWNASTMLSVADPTVSAPQIAVAADGTALATWLRSDGVTLRLESSSRPPGGAWSSPTFVSPVGVQATSPTLAMSPSGVACAAWQQLPPGATIHEVAVAAWTPGSGFGAATPISGPSTFVAGEPMVALDAQGRAVVAWLRNNVIEACEQHVALGRFLPPVAISAAGDAAAWPDLAIDDAGNAVAVYQTLSAGGSTHLIRATMRAAGAGWSTPTTISDTRFATYEDVGPPRVAASADGSLVVATWEDNITLGARAATYGLVGTLGSIKLRAWDRPRTLGSDGLWDDPLPVAAGPNATAVAAWMVPITLYKTRLNAATFSR